MLKKVLSCLLILILALSAVSCADGDGAPDGMKDATVEGEPFSLYIPEAWTVNTASGISSGYYTAVDFMAVSARYTNAPDGVKLEDYTDTSATLWAAEYSAPDEYFEQTESKGGTLINGENALRNTYEFDKASGNDKLRMVAFEIITLHKGMFITLRGYCPKDEYEGRKETFETIRESFVLRELPSTEHTPVVDKNTPEGMQLASNEDIEYRFYVPVDWVTNCEDDITDAYYSESERSNVTVTSYTPTSTDGLDAKKYFEEYLEVEYKKDFSDGYKREGEPEERKIDNYDALLYTYTINAYGVEFKIMQAVIRHGSDDTYYTITYTARAELFDSHLGDVNKMLDNFKFR